MTRVCRITCIALLLIGCTTTGCDLVTDSTKSALNDLAEATVESLVIAAIAQVAPDFVAPPQQRQGLFPFGP